MVWIVRGAVAAVAPVIEAVADAQAGAETALAGALETTQPRVTVPVNPPAGVRVIVEEPVAPGLEMVTAVPAMLSDGVRAASTLTGIVVEAVTLPLVSVPVTVRL